MENIGLCLKAAGSSFEKVLRCTVYVTNAGLLRNDQRDLWKVLSWPATGANFRCRRFVACAVRRRDRMYRARLSVGTTHVVTEQCIRRVGPEMVAIYPETFRGGATVCVPHVRRKDGRNVLAKPG